MVNENETKVQLGFKESELVNKWLWNKHRNSLQWRRVRLGPLPDHEHARAFMVTLRFADAIFIENGEVNIVEAKLKPNAGAVGQLLQYKDLFPSTPEFSSFSHFPIKMWLLTPVIALDIVEMCSKYGIIYEVWTPDEEQRKELERRIKIIKQNIESNKRV